MNKCQTKNELFPKKEIVRFNLKNLNSKTILH